MQQIPRELSKKLKCFLNFLLYFWNLNLILNIGKKKDERHSFCISQVIDGEKGGYVNV